MASPNHAFREDWLALTQEETLVPGQPILDAPHHLWDRLEGRYQARELMTDEGADRDRGRPRRSRHHDAVPDHRFPG